ncbi:MAG: 4Fe-4S dicluster domain-containing protein [Crocinitomicaceae bacterium]|nr:4Fe-4S dicluster domain-containing protein [Crocinitomicaceae bacterium]
MGIANIIFALLFIGAAILFTINVRKILFNIRLGKDVNRTDNKSERMRTMIRVALGQSKMTSRPFAAFLHIIVYAGFILVNLEMLEIFIDGFVGTHRVLQPLLGNFYFVMVNFFEILAAAVALACIVFLVRRNFKAVKRFQGPDLRGWAFKDGNIILITEVLMMSALLIMNAADVQGGFLISSYLKPLLPENHNALHIIEQTAWWFHVVGVFAFLNYLPFSKHLHIIWAFPNTYFSNLLPKGKLTNMESVTREVKLMLDPSADPYAAQPATEAAPQRFGAKDVTDLTWVNIMNAYTCTECGRCTSSCPANITGKKLSPRKIMMDVRDRVEELGKAKQKNGIEFHDGKFLLGDYITDEEVWACTSCNACVQECPVNIDPLSIIIDLRRYLVMEESKLPAELAGMATNIENNQAPWQFSPADRFNWANEA